MESVVDCKSRGNAAHALLTQRTVLFVDKDWNPSFGPIPQGFYSIPPVFWLPMWHI